MLSVAAGQGAPGPGPRRSRMLHALGTLAVGAVMAFAACKPSTPPQRSLAAGEWREFQGTWTAAGSRHAISLGGDRRASIANFNGTLLLSGPSRPNVGFRAEAIVLNDTATGMIGRAVWTDEQGEQVFSELRGEGSAAGNRIVGRFVGGTGRYASATGDYEFTWRFMLQGEDGLVQGQSVGLRGRVRKAVPPSPSSAGGPQP